ncbi:acyltransferase [Clostridium sp. HBUAS56017]|uniref:acyltransferase family protein n=1 Tax=Clostridium sp. HBUAS56017 TaxID=2571128 RepID=UPI001177BA04|nr:acyltransferase [Clostridium sp. HBUAS56017]
MEKRKTLEEFNFLKVIAMITVVLQHSMAVYSNWFRVPRISSQFYKFVNSFLSSYHVYMFVFVSGYLYYYTRYELNRNDDNRTFVYKKYRRLIVPYFCISLLYVMPIRMFTEKSNFSIYNIMNDIILSKNSAHLWFLLMLFGVFVVFRILEKRIESGNIKILCIMFYGAYIVGKLIEKSQVLNILQIHKVLQFAIFFYIGFILRKYNRTILKRVKKVNVLVVLGIQILLTSGVYFLNLYCRSMLVKGISVLIEPIVPLVGILFWYLIIIKILEFKPNIINTKIYVFLKENNFTIYLIHMPIIQLVLIYLYDKNILPTLLVTTCFIISMLISSTLSVVINKFRITKIIFGLDSKKIFCKTK